MQLISNFFRHNAFRSGDIDEFRSKLFFDREIGVQYRARYVALSFMATVIASYGIINNSPATVIGAMIIAPLMTPMMAVAAALVMGDRRQDLQALTLVVIGALLVLAVSWAIGSIHLLLNIISIEQNEQIYTRISPRSTDLIIALASGAAGAFALSRNDVADTLPGVAISISLVPPLCVAGICLAMDEWYAAWGAILLFLTNFLSILLAGGSVFLMLGLHKVTRDSLGTVARRHAFKTVLAGVVLVSIPLVATSSRLASQSITEYRSINAAYRWLEGSGYQVHEVEYLHRGINLVVAGEGELPDVAILQAELERKLRRSIQLTLQIVPIVQERLQITVDED